MVEAGDGRKTKEETKDVTEEGEFNNQHSSGD